VVGIPCDLTTTLFYHGRPARDIESRELSTTAFPTPCFARPRLSLSVFTPLERKLRIKNEIRRAVDAVEMRLRPEHDRVVKRLLVNGVLSHHEAMIGAMTSTANSPMWTDDRWAASALIFRSSPLAGKRPLLPTEWRVCR